MKKSTLKTTLLASAALLAVAIGATSIGPVIAANDKADKADKNAAVDPNTLKTKTPIKHLVVIFDENVSFDHYFGTYPNALNPAGEPAFHALPGTPTVNGLSGSLLTNNPNGSNPVRLDHNDPMTCDQDHGYTAEQSAADHGAEDGYPANTGNDLTLTQCLTGFTYNGKPEPVPGPASNKAVLDYYDGNSVTGLWN